MSDITVSTSSTAIIDRSQEACTQLSKRFLPKSNHDAAPGQGPAVANIASDHHVSELTGPALESLPTELLGEIYIVLEPASKLAWKFTSRALYHATFRKDGKELVRLEDECYITRHCVRTGGVNIQEQGEEVEDDVSSYYEEWEDQSDYEDNLYYNPVMIAFKRMMIKTEIELWTRYKLEKMTCSRCLVYLPHGEVDERKKDKLDEYHQPYGLNGFCDSMFDKQNWEYRICIHCIRMNDDGVRRYHVHGHRRFRCRGDLCLGAWRTGAQCATKKEFAKFYDKYKYIWQRVDDIYPERKWLCSICLANLRIKCKEELERQQTESHFPASTSEDESCSEA